MYWLTYLSLTDERCATDRADSVAGYGAGAIVDYTDKPLLGLTLSGPPWRPRQGGVAQPLPGGTAGWVVCPQYDIVFGNTCINDTVKPVCNDHLYNKINYLWFSQ